MSNSIPYYPTTSQEWRQWILAKLGIAPEVGKEMLLTDTFPYDKLVDLWRREFASVKGYSVAFIPALIRNKRGLVQWVYTGGQEPLWTGSDDPD